MPTTLKSQVLSVVDTMSSVKAVKSCVTKIDWDHYFNVTANKGNVVIFIDPPYNGTTGYGFSLDYVKWLEYLDVPSNCKVYITDYVPHSEDYTILSKTKKGGISGGSKSRVEILSRVR